MKMIVEGRAGKVPCCLLGPGTARVKMQEEFSKSKQVTYTDHYIDCVYVYVIPCKRLLIVNTTI